MGPTGRQTKNSNRTGSSSEMDTGQLAVTKNNLPPQTFGNLGAASIGEQQTDMLSSPTIYREQNTPPLYDTVQDEVVGSPKEKIRPLRIPQFVSAEIVNEFVQCVLRRVDMLEHDYVNQPRWQDDVDAIVENAMSCVSVLLASDSPHIGHEVKTDMAGLTINLTKIFADLIERKCRETTISQGLHRPVLASQVLQPPISVGQPSSESTSESSISANADTSPQMAEIAQLLKKMQNQLQVQQHKIDALSNRNTATSPMRQYEESMYTSNHLLHSHHARDPGQDRGNFRNKVGRVDDRRCRTRQDSPLLRMTESSNEERNHEHESYVERANQHATPTSVHRTEDSDEAVNNGHHSTHSNQTDGVWSGLEPQTAGVDQHEHEQVSLVGGALQPADAVPSPNVSNSSWLVKNLVRVSQDLLDSLVPDCSSSIDRNTLVDLTRNVCPGVEMDRRDVSKTLTKYIVNANGVLDENAVKFAEYAVEKSRLWVAGMRESVRDRGLHGKGLGSHVNKDLGKFGPTSEFSIFEFIQRFEVKTEEYPDMKAKAKLFFDHHLDPIVKQEVQSDSNDYAKMVNKIVGKYGDLTLITNNIIRPLRKLVMIDSNASEVEHLTYFRTIVSTFQKIEHLYTFPQVKKEELELVIHHQDFMCKLFKSLPQATKQAYHDVLKQNNLTIVPLRGAKRYKYLLSTIKDTYDFYDSMVRIDDCDVSGLPVKSKNTSKRHSKNFSAQVYQERYHSESEESGESEGRIPPSSQHSASCSSGDESVEDAHLTFFTKQDKRSFGKKPNVNKQSSNQSKVNNSSKPGRIPEFSCIIPSHRHGIQSCPDFFALEPEKRFEYKMKAPFRMCPTCLKTGACRTKECKFIDEVPKILLCQDCDDYYKHRKRNRLQINIFACKFSNHTRPDKKEIVKALNQYIPEFTDKVTPDCIFMTYNFNVSSHKLSSTSTDNQLPATKSSPVNTSAQIPNLDTTTGKSVKVPDDMIVMESSEHSFLVMQMLQLKSEKVLTFFDRGASCNLVDGALAEKIGLKVISSVPESIGVAGDRQVLSEYGRYQFRIGPIFPEKMFHEVSAIGMQSISTMFPQYDLSPLVEEYREECARRNVAPHKAPKFIGGQKVGLLLGVRDFSLEPVVQFILPNGLAVLRSPLKDCFGSRICFGGPHAQFTKINKMRAGNVNGIFAFLNQAALEYRQSIYPALSQFLDEDYDDLVSVNSKVAVSMVKASHNFTPQFNDGHESVCPTPVTVNQVDNVLCDDDLVPECGSVHHCSCPPEHVFKAKISLKDQRVFLDEVDKDDTINFRCPVCAKCKCSSNPREKLLSVVEQIEQELIERSVTVDLQQRRCCISLPFTQDPVAFMTKRHRGSDNKHQAIRVYQSQLRKSKDELLAMMDVQSSLLEKGFLVKLKDLPKDVQEIIDKAGFRHFMPWRTVKKESSSTPIRLVVDPSMSGLNLILPKGVNQLNKIVDILVRARTKKYLWSTDISKLYNQLKLNPSSFPYQLFLFGDLLSPSSPPETYVLVVGWYGLISTGNQAGYALDELARLLKDKYPRAFKSLTFSRYVDDILDGGSSPEEVRKQVEEVKSVLEAGGFSTKFTVYSGQVPEEEAGSKDGTIGMLGQKWNVEHDTLSPGFSELNFQKKRRGQKPKNPFEVKSIEDVRALLATKNVTRRMVIGKISEIFDPCGLFEPYKLQLKLEARSLSGLDWDEPLTSEKQAQWISRFEQFLQIPMMSIKRCIVPENAVNDQEIRLLCICDAAAGAGGCCVYGGYLLPDGSYSSNLLVAKSRLLDHTVPRNELESLRLAASVANDVVCALGDMVKEVYFFTDSQIALCWAMNTKKKLRMYVLNRVTEIRTQIKYITSQILSVQDDDLPIYHIDGKVNIADLLTKEHDIKPVDLNTGSLWEQGYNWMTYPIDEMGVTKFSDLQITKHVEQITNEECFPDPIVAQVAYRWSQPIGKLNNYIDFKIRHCKGCKRPSSELPIDQCMGMHISYPHCSNCKCMDPAHFSFFLGKGEGSQHDLLELVKLGWIRGLRILGETFLAAYLWYHRVHSDQVSCKMCTAIEDSNSVKHEVVKFFQNEAKQYLLKIEAKVVEKRVPVKKRQSFHKVDGVYMYNSRIENEIEVVQNDLSEQLYFDNTTISGNLPVVMADSHMYFALIMYIHHHVRPHSGVEITYREAMKFMYAMDNPRKIIQQIRRDCPRCRIIRKKTLELQLGPHKIDRFQICPPFYAVQCDTVFGFRSKPHKHSRATIKTYALILVCIVTSATNILALEGLETQDVCQAIARHSARYGAPAVMFVDNGTQLTSLKNTEFSIRDANATLRDAYGIRIEVSAAKSHQSQGRVERKVRTLREMLKQTSETTDLALTCLGWETLFAKISSSIDDVPIARSDKSSKYDPGWELLTPNKLKLGRNNNRSIEGTIKITEGSSPVAVLQKIHQIYQHWYQLLLNRLHHLIPRPEKSVKSDKLNIGDIVTFLYNESVSSKGLWKLGRIVKILNNGRRVEIEFPVVSKKSGPSSLRTLVRSPRDVCIIHRIDELNLNSLEYLEKVQKINA